MRGIFKHSVWKLRNPLGYHMPNMEPYAFGFCVSLNSQLWLKNLIEPKRKKNEIECQMTLQYNTYIYADNIQCIYAAGIGSSATRYISWIKKKITIFITFYKYQSLPHPTPPPPKLSQTLMANLAIGTWKTCLFVAWLPAPTNENLLSIWYDNMTNKLPRRDQERTVCFYLL